MTITGNTFYGSIPASPQSQFPNNTYYSSRPTGVKIFIRPNQYEAKRANITIYNWDTRTRLSVDLTGILAPGTGFEIRNAQDFFGAPVLTGTYAGGSVSIPMTGLSVAAPRGWAAPPRPAPSSTSSSSSPRPRAARRRRLRPRRLRGLRRAVLP